MEGKCRAVPWLSFLLLFLASSSHAATLAWSTLRAGVCSAVAVTQPSEGGTLNVVYASFAGDNVNGPAVLRSEDRGATWTSVLPLRAYSLATTPLSPAKLFAATDNGLFGSADYGATWSQLAPGARSFVAVNAGNDNTLYLDNYRSVDGGATWQAMGGFPTTAYVGKNLHIKTSASNPNFLIAYAGSGAAYVSYNAGVSWALLSGQRSDFYSVGADPVDARYYFVGYCNYIQRWIPGGVSSMPSASGDIYAIESDPGERSKVFASGQSGIFYYSGNYGYSWEASTSGGTLTHYGRMLVDGAEGRLYLPTTLGLRVVSTDPLPVPPPLDNVSLAVGIDNGTAFVPRVNFVPSETVVFRGRATDLYSGLPVPNASFVLSVAGPSTDNVASGPSDANGYADIRWMPTDPTTWKYTATIVSLAPPPGSLWNGVRSSRVFTEGNATRASRPLVGSGSGPGFVEGTLFPVGVPMTFRSRVTDPTTGLPVPNAAVDFTAYDSYTRYAGSASTDADGWAELSWTPTTVYSYCSAYVSRIVPPSGYVWDGGFSSSAPFKTVSAPARPARVDSVAAGVIKTVRKVSSFVPQSVFVRGDTVVLRVKILAADDNTAVVGATATVSVSTGTYYPTFLTTAPSGADGVAEVSWKTVAPSRKSAGSLAGDYLIQVTSTVLPAGYAWDGVVASTTITLN